MYPPAGWSRICEPCSICVLAALGRTNALRLNFRMALRNGAKLPEIFEAIFQVAAYAGFPAAWDALEILVELLRQENISPATAAVPPRLPSATIREGS